MAKKSDDGKWYRVSFRLIGDGVPVDEIESSLGLTPDFIGKKGEHLQGNIIRAKAHTNFWTWQFPAESNMPFEEQISGLLDVIEPKKAILQEIMSLPDVQGELFLGYGSENGQGGAYISHDTLSRLSDLGLSLDIDLYPPPNADED